ncbi:MAG: amidohydrolase [Gemmatimonadales bacterium]
MRRFGWLVGSVVIAAGCQGGAGSAIVLHNGKVFTGNPTAPWAQAVLIVGDRISQVGGNDEVLAAAPRGARRVDVGQRPVIPGLNDAHDHITAALPARVVTMSNDPTPDPTGNEVRDSIAAAAQRFPAGTRFRVSVGELTLSDSRIRRPLLDRIAPNHPVEIVAWSGHGMILNTAALTAAGIADSTPDPIGGRFERDPAGRLTGLLEEYAGYNAAAAVTERTDSATLAAFNERAAMAVRWGITSIQNMTLGVDPEVMRRIASRLDLPVRLRLIRFPLTTKSGVERGALNGLTVGAGVRVSGIKWIVDGTPVERLAALRAPYSDAPNGFGRINIPADTLRALLAEAVAANEQPHLHAVGDSAIGLSLSLLEAVAPDSVWRRIRPRIEHGDGLAADQLERAKRLGVIVVQNPSHFALGPLAVRRYGAARMVGFQPAQSLVRNGIPFALGSDGPPNPFLNIFLATIHPDNPAEALTVEQAVTAYTATSAFAEHQETEKGRIMVGQLADLAVLSQDIFSVPKPTLPGTVSVLTLLGGRAVRDSLGWLGPPR